MATHSVHLSITKDCGGVVFFLFWDLLMRELELQTPFCILDLTVEYETTLFMNRIITFRPVNELLEIFFKIKHLLEGVPVLLI